MQIRKSKAMPGDDTALNEGAEVSVENEAAVEQGSLENADAAAAEAENVNAENADVTEEAVEDVQTAEAEEAEESAQEEQAEEVQEETAEDEQASESENEQEESAEQPNETEEAQAEGEQPVLQTIIGFENTEAIQKELKTMMDNHGRRIIENTMQFVGLMNDYLPDYDRERRLLVSAANIGVVKNMVLGDDKDIAVMRARSLIMDELYVIENAAEFVLACYTYMLGWVYESEFRVRDEEPETDSEPQEQEKQEPVLNLNVESKVFTKFDAFKYRLTRKIVVPDGYTKLEDFCFDGNTWMRTVTLPSTVLAIGSYAFCACKHLKGIVLPERIRRIEANAFSQCTDLAMVKIPKGVLEIDDNAFSFCTSLKTLDVPNTVSSIGLEAFSCCTSLKKLYLPESVKFIDADAFLNCSELTVYCYENSYVHKYCIKNEINVKTAAAGCDLHSIDAKEGED